MTPPPSFTGLDLRTDLSRGRSPHREPRRRGEPSIVLIGFMTSGKSTVGRLIAARLGREFVETDAAIERDAGRSIPEIFADEGERGFRARERAVVRRLARPGRVIATGGGVVLSGENRRFLRRCGYVVHLVVRSETVLERARDDETERPLLAGPDPAARVRGLLEERAPLYAMAHLAVGTDWRSPPAVADRILAWFRDVNGPGSGEGQ